MNQPATPADFRERYQRIRARIYKKRTATEIVFICPFCEVSSPSMYLSYNKELIYARDILALQRNCNYSAMLLICLFCCFSL